MTSYKTYKVIHLVVSTKMTGFPCPWHMEERFSTTSFTKLNFLYC